MIFSPRSPVLVGRDVSGKRRRICFVVASEITVTAFLIDPIRRAALQYDVCVALNTLHLRFLEPYNVDAEVVSVPLERKIRPLADLKALFALWQLFRVRRFDLVHSVSPKAGFLAMLAGFLARVPRRVHVFTGQVWVTHSGLPRLVLKSMDRLLVALATHILIDSRSQRDFLIAEKVVSATNSTVLGQGSISGVDAARFCPDREAFVAIRRELQVPDHGVLFLYLGRLSRDKGLLDLAAAFADLGRQRDDVWLVLVGPDEEGLASRIVQVCRDCIERVRIVAYTSQPERFMAAADVFCLPSYREGFGSVIIEAAACGVPAIASRIYGVTDAVADGVTGILHPPGDIAALTAAMARLAQDPQLRRELGNAARRRALADFQMAALTAALLGFYAKILN